MLGGVLLIAEIGEPFGGLGAWNVRHVEQLVVEPASLDALLYFVLNDPPLCRQHLQLLCGSQTSHVGVDELLSKISRGLVGRPRASDQHQCCDEHE